MSNPYKHIRQISFQYDPNYDKEDEEEIQEKGLILQRQESGQDDCHSDIQDEEEITD